MRKKRILHVMSELPEKYNSKFVDFSESRLDCFDHVYLPLKCDCSRSELNQRHPKSQFLWSSSTGLLRMLVVGKHLRSSHFDLVVFHGFFYGGACLIILALIIRLFGVGSRALWMTWGGDTYFFQNGTSSAKGRISQWIRSYALRHMRFAGAALPQEESLIKYHYSPRADFYNLYYPSPILIAPTRNPSDKCEDKGEFNVLAGNSADPSNDHVGLFHELCAAKINLNVYSPLAYGDRAYAQRVVQAGSEIFASKFVAQLEMLSPEEYQKVLDRIDFGAFYHNRQQALGNILYLLAQGKPVLLRPDTLSYEFMKDRGWAVGSIFDLANFSSRQLQDLQMVASDLQLREEVARFFSEEKAAVVWENALWRMLARVSKSFGG